MAKSTSAAVSAPSFRKKNIVGSAKYAKYKDLLSVILEDDKSYTDDEILALIQGYLSKRV